MPSDMTLRDYFAAQALAGMSGNGWVHGERGDGGPDVYDEESGQTIAEICYQMADAMMLERARSSEATAKVNRDYVAHVPNDPVNCP